MAHIYHSNICTVLLCSSWSQIDPWRVTMLGLLLIGVYLTIYGYVHVYIGNNEINSIAASASHDG